MLSITIVEKTSFDSYTPKMVEPFQTIFSTAIFKISILIEMLLEFFSSIPINNTSAFDHVMDCYGLALTSNDDDTIIDAHTFVNRRVYPQGHL